SFLEVQTVAPAVAGGFAFLLKDNFNYRNDLKKSQCYFKKTLKLISSDLFLFIQPFWHAFFQLAQCIPPVGNCRFFVRLKFGHSFVQSRHIENRVIAKTIVASALVKNRPFTRSRKGFGLLSW